LLGPNNDIDATKVRKVVTPIVKIQQQSHNEAKRAKEMLYNKNGKYFMCRIEDCIETFESYEQVKQHYNIIHKTLDVPSLYQCVILNEPTMYVLR
jgi:hypothetical protein